ncbi:MAG: NUDIX hydrolase [Candidatus Sericytochromatia bacterium]|nr:NUDIX hydrolase [Candidatus Sericytochromatia bacterium]
MNEGQGASADLRERGLTRELIHAGHLRLHLDTVMLPNGRMATREVIEHPGAVAIVALPDDRHVLMVRQYRHAISELTWELPGGGLEPRDASPLAAAQRELAEETGHTADHWHLVGCFHASAGYTTELTHLFEARGLRPVPTTRPEDEFVDLHAINHRDALDWIAQGVIRDAKSIIGLLRCPPTP